MHLFGISWIHTINKLCSPQNTSTGLPRTTYHSKFCSFTNQSLLNHLSSLEFQNLGPKMCDCFVVKCSHQNCTWLHRRQRWMQLIVSGPKQSLKLQTLPEKKENINRSCWCDQSTGWLWIILQIDNLLRKKLDPLRSCIKCTFSSRVLQRLSWLCTVGATDTAASTVLQAHNLFICTNTFFLRS